MDVGKRITFFRSQKNYSVNKLANLAGISQSYLRDIELGNKNPTIEIISIICDALDLTLQDFFSDDTISSIQNNEILKKFYQLNKEQQKTLLAFIDTIIS